MNGILVGSLFIILNFFLLNINGILKIHKNKCNDKKCVMPECDPQGSISMCYMDNVVCPPFHEKVKNDEICSKIGKQCCRSTCRGNGTFCIEDLKPCPDGYSKVTGEGVKCPFSFYNCCAK